MRSLADRPPDAPRDPPRLRPRALRTGDLVRIVSPSFPALALVAHRRPRAEHALRQLGLRVDYAAHAFHAWGHLAGAPEERADDINSAFRDEEVAGILCALGGSDCLDLVPLLDYAEISRRPKLFIGHSSIATLMLALLARSHLITFHGPSLVNQFGEFPEPLAETVSGFRAACMTSDPLVLRPMTRRTDALPAWWHEADDAEQRDRNLPGGWRWLKPGRAAGPFIGGYLPYLLDVVGTPWMPPLDEAILFTDMMALNALQVDGMLGELVRRGVLARLAGLVIGVPARFVAHPAMGTLVEVVAKWAADVSGPILVDADCGHADPVWTVPMGTWAVLDSATDSLVCEPGTVGTGAIR